MPEFNEPLEELAICGQACLEGLLRLQHAMREIGNHRGAGDVSSAVGCLLSAMDQLYGIMDQTRPGGTVH